MGVDATDYDNDGWQDLFVANIDQELFSLYQNQKDLSFIDKPGEMDQRRACSAVGACVL